MLNTVVNLFLNGDDPGQAEKTMSKPGPACLRLAEHPDPDLMAQVTKAGHDLSIEKNDDVIC